MAANPRPTDPEFSVLYLTHHLPFPPTSGGRRREYELLRRLGDEANIHALAITKTPEEDRRDRGRLLRHCAAVELFPARPPTHRRLPRQVARHHSAKGARRLRELLERRRLDLIHVEGFYLWPLLQGVPGTRRPPTVLVEHNVEHELWQQRAERAPREHRDELLAEAARTRAAELEAWREADQ